MAKVIISASVEEDVIDEVSYRATVDRRSFSAMVDIVLRAGLAAMPAVQPEPPKPPTT